MNGSFCGLEFFEFKDGFDVRFCVVKNGRWFLMIWISIGCCDRWSTVFYIRMFFIMFCGVCIFYGVRKF